MRPSPSVAASAGVMSGIPGADTRAPPRPAAAARFISSRRVTSDTGAGSRVTTAGGRVPAGHVGPDRVHTGPRVAFQRAHRGVPGAGQEHRRAGATTVTPGPADAIGNTGS